MKTIMSVVGTRPNFMKMGPIEDILKTKKNIKHVIVHTGQHYDANMSDDFFKDFDLRSPDYCLRVSGGGLADQTGRIMVAFEKVLLKVKPDLVITYGDVNSTFAATWTAKQNHIPVAHVEAGLRSFDRNMPEEVNRVCTDALSDILFCTHSNDETQLQIEGIPFGRCHIVGNIMLDYLVKYGDQAFKMAYWKELGFGIGEYNLATLHRPGNVNDSKQLLEMISKLTFHSIITPIIFPVHPRTKKQLLSADLMTTLNSCKTIKVIEPVSYIKFLSLMIGAKKIYTDSGGIQAEASFLDVPCEVLRDTTEWAICRDKSAKTIPLWDGNTAERIVKNLEKYLGI